MKYQHKSCVRPVAFRTCFLQAPAEVVQTFHYNPPIRTRFAGPPGKSFRSSFERHPRCRSKAQAAKKPLTLFSPYPQKSWIFPVFLNFFDTILDQINSLIGLMYPHMVQYDITT